MLGLSKNGAGIKPGEHLLGLLEMMLYLGSMLAEKAAAQTERRPSTLERVADPVYRAAAKLAGKLDASGRRCGHDYGM